MNESGACGPRRFRQRNRSACEGRGRGGGRSSALAGNGRGGEANSLVTRTATRVLVAAGAYVAQDLRDPEGLSRPLLRRAAIWMLSRPTPALRRLGAAYLRQDGHQLPGAAPRLLALPSAPGTPLPSEEPVADPVLGRQFGRRFDGGPEAGYAEHMLITTKDC